MSTHLTVGQLMREASVLRPTDSVGRAAEALRFSVYSALPVVDNGQLVGIVTEENLRRLFPLISSNGSNGDGQDKPTVDLIMRRDVSPVPDSLSLSTLSAYLEQQPLDVLPVVDALGQYRGMISRADVIAAQCEAIRPPLIGGMATPLGVYLTTGALRAGAGHLGLLLTGVFMGTRIILTQIIITVVCLLIDRWRNAPHEISYVELYQRAEALPPLSIGLVFTLCSIFLFMLLIRLSGLAGYHAAEHQVVHAIERAEPLIPEIVRTMPRPHPRCGTNLVVGFGLLYFSLMHLPREVSLYGVALTVLFWKRVGAWMQQHFTTKPANDKQLLNGIRAGEELLRQYREHPEPPSSLFQRIVNMGLPQVLAGAWAVVVLWQTFLYYLAVWSVRLG